jgi:molybdopterin-containing oxidoreductase family membrane subunit
VSAFVNARLPSPAWPRAKGANGDVITAALADPILERHAGRAWWIALAGSFLLVLIMLAAIVYLFAAGIGTWGVNTTVVWGYAIASYVWWIAIGSGGTLISSVLVLTRQRWRVSVNRLAETMTVFAVAIAGIFPILHLGRPQYFYWLAPYPNTMLLWPQW